MSTADVIIISDRVHTLDPAGPPARAVAVRDGVIVALGQRRDVRAWRGPRTRVLDLGPAVLTPGLVDGHCHPVIGIDLTTGVDLSGVHGLDELRAVVAAEAARLGRDDWFRGYGLEPDAFAVQPVTAAPLTEVLGDRPTLVIMFDAHAALARAGITGPRAFDGGASIVCDDEGVPTGHLLEFAAMDLVRNVVPADAPAPGPAGRGPRRDGLDRGHRRERDGLRRRLRGAGRRVRAGGRAADPAALPPHLPARHGPGRAGAPRGAPGRRRAPVAHRRGQVLHRRHDRRRHRLAGAARRARRVAAPVLARPRRLHRGDAVPGRSRRGDRHPRDRRPGRALRARRAGRAARRPGAAPRRTRRDAAGGAGRPVRRAGRDRQHAAVALHPLPGRRPERQLVASARPRARRAGLPDARPGRGAGRGRARSDWPVAPYDARWGLADAQLRRRWDQPDDTPIGPSQALTAAMALAGYTTAAARADGQADRSGTIAVGKRADLTAFTVDPLTAPPDELATAPIALTVVGGGVVHQDPAFG